MGLSHEHVGPKILAKIQIYILTRAELLFTLCSETPCTYRNISVLTQKIAEIVLFLSSFNRIIYNCQVNVLKVSNSEVILQRKHFALWVQSLFPFAL